jgi:hypothetical protein
MSSGKSCWPPAAIPINTEPAITVLTDDAVAETTDPINARSWHPIIKYRRPRMSLSRPTMRSITPPPRVAVNETKYMFGEGPAMMQYISTRCTVVGNLHVVPTNVRVNDS